jgi:two-component system chemotaxis sensor kinase CheA
MAIIDGLLVRIGQGYFILPLVTVEECVELTLKDIKEAHGRDLANVRGELVPYIPLRQQFGIGGAAGHPADRHHRVDGNRIGLVVDQVVGQHQAVINPWDNSTKGGRSVRATILGDGTLALILDIPRSSRVPKNREK